MAVLANNRVCAADDALDAALVVAIERMGPESAELLTCYHGVDVSEDEAQALSERLGVQYPSLEIEVVFGGQPHYPFLLTLE